MLLTEMSSALPKHDSEGRGLPQLAVQQEGREGARILPRDSQRCGTQVPTLHRPRSIPAIAQDTRVLANTSVQTTKQSKNT